MDTLAARHSAGSSNLAPELVKTYQILRPRDDDLVFLVYAHALTPWERITKNLLVKKVDFDLLPLADLGGQLWFVFSFVDKIKDEGAVYSRTDELVILIVSVLVVEVDIVDKPDRRDVNRSN